MTMSAHPFVAACATPRRERTQRIGAALPLPLPLPPAARRRALSQILGAAIAAAVVPRLVRAHQPSPAASHGFELPAPKALQPFALTDHRGRPFGIAGLQRRWTLLLFGYTQCADVCPTTLLEMSDARRRLARDRIDIDSAAVFVSVDPERDTLTRLAEYVGRFGDGLVGLRGPHTAVKGLAEQLRVRYAAAQASGSTVVDHTASVALLGPDAALYAVFTLPLRPAAVAADIARLHGRWVRSTEPPAKVRPA
jgi:protein SCO1